MGLFPPWTPEQKAAFEERWRHKQEVIAAAGFKPLKGWFGKLCDEFFSKYKYSAGFEKDGKIYAWIQVEVMLGLEYADDSEWSKKVRREWLEVEPPDLAPWLERKEVLKKELGIDYDTVPEFSI